jgi:hypothetical protein
VSLAFGALAAPAAAAPQAQSTPDLTGLAAYFPADTPLYIGVRTDTAFVDELDSLVRAIAAKVPEAGMVGSLRSMLDQGISQTFGSGETFDSVFGPWLGSSAAIGVLSLDSTMQGNTNDAPVLFAASITDRDKAEAFVNGLIDKQHLPLVPSTQGDFTVYSYGIATPEATEDSTTTDMSYTDASIPAIAVSDDAILIAKTRADLPLNSDFLSLDKTDGFDVVSRLPETGYNAIVYANLGTTLQTVMSQLVAQMRAQGSDTSLYESLLPIYSNYPTQAVGFTILDGKALTVDLAQGPIDYSSFRGTPFGSLDFNALLNAPAVDPSFASHIPADAIFSAQGTNLGATINYLLDAIGYGVQYGMQAYQQANTYSDSDTLDRLPPFLRDIQPEDVRAFVDLAVAGLTGLNLEDDLLANINSDSALFGRLVPVGDSSFTYDTALVVKFRAATALTHVFDQLKVALDRYKASYTSEGEGTFVLPDVIRGFIPDSLGLDLSDTAFDFLIGHAGDVAAIGTRGAVEFALNGDGASLADDPSYQSASKYFLDGAQSVWYLGGASICHGLSLVAPMVTQMGGSSYELQQVDTVLGLIDSASITTAMNDQGTTARLVLSLNTEAEAPEATATAEVETESTVEPLIAETAEATP